MVRQVDARKSVSKADADKATRRSSIRGAAPKAVLAVLAGTGILIWHMLACTESPMAFSPDGKNLALVVMEPYDLGDVSVAGVHNFRLLVVSDRKTVRVVEETRDAMLTSPAFDPDGSELCYLRIPLPTADEAKRLKDLMTSRKEAWSRAMSQPATYAAVPKAATGPAAGWTQEDMTMPGIANAAQWHNTATESPVGKVELVIRRTKDYSIVKELPIDLLGVDWSKEDLFMESYLLGRSQYSSDGKWINLSVGDVVMSVNPGEMKQRILAVPAWSPTASPDGRTIALLQEHAIGLVQADGRKTTYLRLDDAASMSGIAWAGDDTLAVLCEKPSGQPASGPASRPAKREMMIRLMKTDGTALPALKFSVELTSDPSGVEGELAVSRDGKNMVVSLGKSVYFLDAGGKVVKQINTNEGAKDATPQILLVQPTFTPDSKTVAMRRMTKESGGDAVTEVVFFTPDGKELTKVAIPASKPK